MGWVWQIGYIAVIGVLPMEVRYRLLTQCMSTVTIEIPDDLMSQLERTGYPVQDIVVKALESYVQAEDAASDITQTRTWQLCGSFEVSEPAPEYIVGQDEKSRIITNYAEKVDDVLY